MLLDYIMEYLRHAPVALVKPASQPQDLPVAVKSPGKIEHVTRTSYALNV